jgi:CheY-like chemotaxis protein
MRILLLAREPYGPAQLGLDDLETVESTTLIRSTDALETAVAESRPTVIVIDVRFPDEAGITAIEDVRLWAKEAPVLALTSSPAPPDEVALATQAGAQGFVEVDSPPAEVATALRALDRGEAWLPPDETRAVLTSVAGDLDTTRAERRSRLTGIVIALIPLAGVMAAILSLLWRRYLGDIGVRPVDIAVDPGSRVVDAVSSIFLLLGIVGPLVFIHTWLDLLRNSRFNRGALGALLERRRLAGGLMFLLILGVGLFLSLGPDELLVLVIGPITGIAILARALDLSDQLPRFLRIQRVSPTKVLVGGTAALLLFLGLLGAEAIYRGPEFGPEGERGWIAPHVLGFSAQPMRVFNVETGDPPRELLYLGGNADLYVLVDPCNDDLVEYVSVGRHRLVVIDEVACPN